MKQLLKYNTECRSGREKTDTSGHENNKINGNENVKKN